MTALKNRYDFVLLFDVKDGNPNGDPDAGNLPRVDAETGRGLVTDVCLKRKVRNYVSLKHNFASPHSIYIREKAVLGRAHVEAFQSLGIELGQEVSVVIPPNLLSEFEETSLPTGLSVKEEDEVSRLILDSDFDKEETKTWLKDAKKDKSISASMHKFLGDATKQAKSRKPKQEEVVQGRQYMCEHYYDIRTFGAVMSLKSAPNCGQVRGPVQLTFGRSVEPIVSLEHSITRMAVATEAEAEKQSGDNRTMGRKFTVPYGLYVAHGFVSAHLAAQTGFSEEDLQLFWEALVNMFDHDRSAARGEMATRGLYIFKHASELGNAPAHSLFKRIDPKLKPKSELKDGISVARDFEDYGVAVNRENLPQGVELQILGV
jgi:CRISPR-associated protein Csd2